MSSRTAIRVRTKCSDSADHQFKWSFDLRTIAFRRIELGRHEDRFQSLTNISIVFREGCCDSIHQSRGRLVGNKVTREFGGDELCCRPVSYTHLTLPTS